MVLPGAYACSWLFVAALHYLQEPNIRYLALENLTRLALVPEVLESISAHQVCPSRTVQDLSKKISCCCHNCNHLTASASLSYPAASVTQQIEWTSANPPDAVCCLHAAYHPRKPEGP